MPARSLRSRLAKNLVPLKPRLYKSDEGLEIRCQVIGPVRVELSPVRQFETHPDVIQIPATVSPVDLSQILEVDVVYEEIDLSSQLAHPTGTPVTLFDHLFEPLGWTDVDGQHYETRQAGTEDRSAQPRQGRPRLRPQLRKSYELADERPSKTSGEKLRYRSFPSFWDIILPILQPPLDLGAAKPIFLPSPLYPFQHPGVEFLLDHTSALLGDEMGTGKTVTASVAMRILFRRAQIRCALVVCPVSVLRTWDQHLMEWAPELSVTVVHGPSAMRRIDWATPAHVYLTTYDTLHSDIHKGNVPRGMWRQFDLVAADEIQHVKSASSKLSQALCRLAPGWRWGLSGTPMENSPEAIVSIFRFLKPGLMAEGDPPDRIREKLASYFLRRRKKDVWPDLPPKIRDPQWLELDPAQRRAYEALEAEIRSDFAARRKRDGGVSRVHILAAIQKLQQICNFAPGRTRSPKTDALKDIVEEAAANHSKVIVFSQYVKEGIAKLEPLLEPFGVARVVGGQSKAVYDAEIDRFKRDAEIHVLLATIKSGGVGLTLAEASYVVHFDHWWNPALKWQAEDRVRRPGQQAAYVNIYEFWMSNTIDRRIFDILEEKREIFEAILDSLSVDELEWSISDDEWLSILGVSTDAQPAQTQRQPQATEDPTSITEILEKLQAVDPFDFERLVGELFKHLGYPFTQVISKSSDGGIDVLAWRNTPDGPERVAVQCKRYQGNVGVEVARELAGVVSSNPAIHKGILVTTGGLTPDCQRFCASTPELEVIRGLQLARHLRNFGILVQ